MHAFFKFFAPDEIEALFKEYPNVKLDFAPGWQMFEGFAAHYDKWYRLLLMPDSRNRQLTEEYYRRNLL